MATKKHADAARYIKNQAKCWKEKAQPVTHPRHLLKRELVENRFEKLLGEGYVKIWRKIARQNKHDL